MATPRRRTQGRELAVQCLYQLDVLGASDLVDASDLEPIRSTSEWSTIPGDAKDFAREIVEACWRRRDELDRTIRTVAEHWDLERMAILDRNILRLAIYELMYRDDIPPNVSINEAIELGKKFSTKGSGSFINGILDRIKKTLPELAARDGSTAAADERAPDSGDRDT